MVNVSRSALRASVFLRATAVVLVVWALCAPVLVNLAPECDVPGFCLERRQGQIEFSDSGDGSAWSFRHDGENEVLIEFGSDEFGAIPDGPADGLYWTNQLVAVEKDGTLHRTQKTGFGSPFVILAFVGAGLLWWFALRSVKTEPSGA